MFSLKSCYVVPVELFMCSYLIVTCESIDNIQCCKEITVSSYWNSGAARIEVHFLGGPWDFNLWKMQGKENINRKTKSNYA